MITAPEIDKLFGKPLNTIPKPNLPYQPKAWHFVVGATVLGLTIYGAYALQRDAKQLIKEKYN